MDWPVLIGWSQGWQGVVVAAGFVLSVGLVFWLRPIRSEVHKRGALVKDGTRTQCEGTQLKRRCAHVLTLAGVAVAARDEAKQEWRSYARTFLAAVVRRCHRQRQHDPAELWRLLTVASSDELRPIVAGTPAQPFLEPDNARMFGSIRSVTGSAAAALEHIQ